MQNDATFVAAKDRRVRAYFAPVNRETGAAAEFVMARDGRAAMERAPAGWIDAGAVSGFKRTSGTQTEAVRCGSKGATAAQFRKTLDAQVEFGFEQWGKTQMAIACGSEQMNLLAVDAEGETLAPEPLLEGSTATELHFAAGAVEKFSVGDLVAVDVDYTGQTGYVGAGCAGAWVRSAGERCSDFVRRVTLNVGRVAAKTADTLILDSALIGAVVEGAKAQAVIGFCDREGSAFFHEWSAVFAIPKDGGARMVLHYPRLQAAAGASEETKEIGSTKLRACLRALPVRDVVDGEQVVCWRAVFP